MTLASALGGCAAEKTNVIHQERSLYRNIYVTQEKGQRCMTFRVRLTAGPQGCIQLKDPALHSLDYSKLEMAGLYVVPDPQRVLVIGLGVGVIPRTVQELYPDAQMDVVEIDPAVVKIARNYFDYAPGRNVRVVVDDGRHFVRAQLRNRAKYDLIFLDAFNGEYIPEHMVTAEFLTEVKGLLSDHGAVAANTWSTSKLFDSESATYNKVFGGFASINRGNRIILATATGAPAVAVMTANASKLEPRLRRYGVTEKVLVSMLDGSPKWDSDAPILTDQYSPANLLNQ
ncbi:MAG: fused MFS/spermidine synthase [Sphingomicrobium sp.]